jgi:penicillin-binding protein 2
MDKSGVERKFKCWKIHGWVDFWRAMAESCDSYFYLLGKKLGAQSMFEIGQMFGLGQAAQDMMSGENKGHLPNPLWKKKMGLGGWSTGDTYNMAIGQGFVTCTPLQIAVLMSGLATHGQIHRPYVVSQVVDANGKALFQAAPKVWRTVQLKDHTWEALNQALQSVVTQGTGSATRIKHLEVRGKTGTAQNPHGQDHAWFAGYAGYIGEKPSVAVCVFIENGGHGGVVAAPIARHIFEMALPEKQDAVEVATEAARGSI